MRITGDSMDSACIRHCDIIVVDRALTASHNTIVVVRVGEQFTVKRLLLYKRKTYEGKHVAASRFVKKNDFTRTPCMYSREENKPMSASQERQPTLDSIAPRSLVADMEQALAFYGQLGFVTTYHDEGFAIVERDGVALHFNASESEEPPHDHLLGWIDVTNIETLYQQYVPTGAIQSPLQVQPWGMKEFVLCDPDRHLLIFGERIPVTSSQPGQPTLISIAPRVPVGDMEQALAFYAQLGFATTTRSGEFASVERDGISLHFTVAEGHSVCWIGVTHIEALYQQYLPTGAIRSPLRSQPWGMKEFFLCDPFRTLLLFGESIPAEESSTPPGA